MIKVLIVEDETKIAIFVKKGLVDVGYKVDIVGTGEDALDLINDDKKYNLIILDLMLPDSNGFDICKRLRSNNIQIPILMLTAKNAIEDKIKGLEIGGDDYLTKPFAIEELVARVHALLRRGASRFDNGIIKVGDIVLDIHSHEVSRGEKLIELSQKEFSILEYMMKNEGMVLTRSMIEDHAWDYELDGFSNVVDVYIRLLRKKIDEGHKHKLIKTVRGVGYKIKA